jgi:hypothetical protein
VPTTLPNPGAAGTPSSPGSADALLKDFYLPKIVSLLNEKHELLKKLGRDPSKFSGRQVKFPVTTGRENGIGARSENSSLPRASVARTVQASIYSKTLTGRTQFTGQMMEKSKSDRGAFAQEAKRQMEMLTEGLLDDTNRQLYGVEVTVNDADGTAFTGKTGLFGYVTSGQASATQTLSTTANLVKGMSICFGTTAEFGSGSWSTQVIDSVDSATQITLENSVTTATNDGVTRGDADGVAFDAELTGLEFIIKSSGTFQGISATTYPNWKSTVTDASSGYYLDDDRIQAMLDTIGDNCGTEPDMIVCHRTQRRLYLSTLLPSKRFAGQDLKGGFANGLSYQGGDKPVPLFVDKHCPTTTAYFLNTGDITMFVEQDWQWMEEDGAILNRVAGKFNYEATMTAMKELGCFRRNSHGKYTNLATS